MNIDNLTLYNLQEETKIHIKNRFKEVIEMNVVCPREVVIFTKEKLMPVVMFSTQISD